MTRQELYAKIKKEAIALAEEDLRTIAWSEIYGTPGGKKNEDDTKVLNPDWHPYYMRIKKTKDGVDFSLVVRGGEVEYFRRKKLEMPDFETPAIAAIRKIVKKYHVELLTLDLVDRFNKIEGAKAEWHPDDQNQ